MTQSNAAAPNSRPIAVSLMVGVPDAPAAVAWYQRAVDAKLLWSLGSVAGMEIGGAPIFVGEPANNGWMSPDEIGTTTVRVEIFCDDPDAFVARAVSEGATGSDKDPVRNHETPWGAHRQGSFVDPFGHKWLVGDHSPLRQFPPKVE